MDEKNYGSVHGTWHNFNFPSHRPFPHLSLKQKTLTKYVFLSLVIVFALTLSAIAILTSASPSPKNISTPLPALADVEDEEASVGATGSIAPIVTVWYHGTRIGQYENDAASVSDALESFNITLSENDVVNFSPDETIYWGMNINVDEVIFEEIEVFEDIPYETVEILSQTVPKGERVVAVEGKNGRSGKIVWAKKVNGEIVNSEDRVETFYEAPVTEEIHIGTGGTFTAPDGTEHNYSYYIDVTATAYTHTGNLTYSGTTAEVGVIAVDPRYIPLGSEVYVIGNYGDYGVCRAEDIGGGIKRYRIDVFLDTEEECVLFGRRAMRCYVLE